MNFFTIHTKKGFTLIELTIVLAIIGLLAIFAVPNFLNLNDQSKTQATNSLAAALTTASTNNYVKRTANNAQGTVISDCTGIGGLLTGGLPTSYTIGSLSISAGTSATCTLNGIDGATATFIGIGIS